MNPNMDPRALEPQALPRTSGHDLSDDSAIRFRDGPTGRPVQPTIVESGGLLYLVLVETGADGTLTTRFFRETDDHATRSIIYHGGHVAAYSFSSAAGPSPGGTSNVHTRRADMNARIETIAEEHVQDTVELHRLCFERRYMEDMDGINEDMCQIEHRQDEQEVRLQAVEDLQQQRNDSCSSNEAANVTVLTNMVGDLAANVEGMMKAMDGINEELKATKQNNEALEHQIEAVKGATAESQRMQLKFTELERELTMMKVAHAKETEQVKVDRNEKRAASAWVSIIPWKTDDDEATTTIRAKLEAKHTNTIPTIPTLPEDDHNDIDKETARVLSQEGMSVQHSEDLLDGLKKVMPYTQFVNEVEARLARMNFDNNVGSYPRSKPSSKDKDVKDDELDDAEQLDGPIEGEKSKKGQSTCENAEEMEAAEALAYPKE